MRNARCHNVVGDPPRWIGFAFSILASFSGLTIATIEASSNKALTLDQQGRDEPGVTALMRAARDGERQNVAALLQPSVDIDAKDAANWTALVYAAAMGDEKIVKMLLDKGANINGSDEGSDTPLMEASHYGNASVVKLLIGRGADVNRRNGVGSTALSMANRSGKKVVELLKKAGAVDGQPNQSQASTTPASSTESPPELLNSPMPRYTLKARKEGIQGVVRTRVLIGDDGTVKRVRILTGLPFGLSYQAMDAAYQLRFKPATKDGRPVAFWKPVEIEFRLR
jgi:TonB family protein